LNPILYNCFACIIVKGFLVILKSRRHPAHLCLVFRMNCVKIAAIFCHMPFLILHPFRSLFLDCPNCVDESQYTPNKWTMPLLKLGEKRYYLGIFFKVSRIPRPTKRFINKKPPTECNWHNGANGSTSPVWWVSDFSAAVDCKMVAYAYGISQPGG